MKKIMSLLVVIGFACFMALPLTKAAEVNINDAMYGTTVENTHDWTASQPYVGKTYYVTKTNGAGYVYFRIIPTLNVKNIKITNSSTAFEEVSKVENTDGSVTVVMKTKNGQALNGTKEELVYVQADFTGNVSDPNAGCEIDWEPLTLNCATNISGHYFDNTGKEVTQEEYTAACSNEEIPQDVPTGNVIPYLAIAGGIIAIAGVYLYSRRSNKIYKI